jgi:hypothetical protein
MRNLLEPFRAAVKQWALIPIAIVCAASIAGCQSLEPARRRAYVPSPPSSPPANASQSAERKVLLDQLQKMAQQDAY